MKVATLRDVLMDELQDLLDAEKQLVRALPKTARAVSHPELESLLQEHLEVTKGQVDRLERVFGVFGERPKSKPCPGMKGLVEEQQEIVSENQGQAMLDASLLGAAQKVEHYEIAGYSNCIALAQEIGMTDAVRLLEETLREEVEAERKLVRVGKRILKEASSMGVEEERPRRRAAGRTSRGASGGNARAGRSGSARPLIDHDEIRRWAEERGAQPASVRGTGRRRGDIGMIRLDFPGFSGEKSLEHISWDEWFKAFDENNLALMVQEQTAGGRKSNFNKIVSRETVEARSQKPRVKRAGG